MCGIEDFSSHRSIWSGAGKDLAHGHQIGAMITPTLESHLQDPTRLPRILVVGDE